MATEPLRILGHRGSPRQARENTVDSFRIALLEGADGFETDLRRLADGTIVLFHDAKAGATEISSMSLAELRGVAPDVATLDDLAPFARRCTIVLEIKESGFEREVLDRVAAWQPTGAIILSSFRRDVLVTLARLGSGLDLGLVTDEPIADPADDLRRHGARWLFPHESLVTNDLVTALREGRFGVIPWTANLHATWGKLANAGCHGWITDHPAEAVAWRNERRNG